jgi:MmeI, DNA-methyltransferase domain/MmeI, N-terminal domain/MmeI, helicase spacer domain
MNAVEIEEAISELVQRYADEGFDADNFPFDFLAAFGNPEATIKRLRTPGKSSTNQSDVGGVLQSRNIHIKIAPPGEVTDTLRQLVDSPETVKRKCKFALATDGVTLEAENLTPAGDGETLACDFADLPDRFAFFLELAGIRTVKAIRENAFDVKATGRLNKLYVELLRHNPEWGTAERREDMNHFMARLIFCFFAEDTGIFHAASENERDGGGLFTNTVQRMSESDAANTHDVIAECFRAMDTPANEKDRKAAKIRPYASRFPYVNGGLFGGAGESTDVPTFSKLARAYLLHIGGLDWTKINPDIFGSMIQAVADDEERGALGMHYTSVPNILKVLNPLFLDELREKLEAAGDRPQALRHLRKRLSRIRVFDPACGSGNFLVIAYKHMREIEFEINKRLGESHRSTDIPLTNFRGIELRHFAAEIARLALVIAEYQCDVLHRGQKLALAEFLPLDAQNWITHGNALRIDWLTVCPPTGTEAKMHADDLFETPLDQTEIDFENEGGETYICGNPPYVGSQLQTDSQKADMRTIFDQRTKNWKSVDYIAAWFMKAADYGKCTEGKSAFVTTNSLCQGRQVENFWPLVMTTGHEIDFAHTSFRWSNLASHNAGVTVVIVGRIQFRSATPGADK